MLTASFLHTLVGDVELMAAIVAPLVLLFLLIVTCMGRR